MAEQMDKDLVEQLKAAYPGYTVAAYINTTAELKTVCDVCVTSSSAVKILSAMPEKDILFIPDINLGTYIQKQLPEKNIKLVHGGCPTHVRAGVKEVRKAKASHPGALLLVHPECLPEVVEMAGLCRLDQRHHGICPVKAMRKNLSSAPRTALPNIFSMNVRKSGFIRYQRIWSVTT